MRLSRLYEEQTVKKEYITMVLWFIGMTDTDALKIDIYQIFNDL